MKKITFSALLCTALFCGGLSTATAQTQAEPTLVKYNELKPSEEVYYIKSIAVGDENNTRGYLVTNTNTDNDYVWTTVKDGAKVTTTDTNSDALKWIVVEEEGTKYLYNIEKKKFINLTLGNAAGGYAWKFTNESDGVRFESHTQADVEQYQDNKICYIFPVEAPASRGSYSLAISNGFNYPVGLWHETNDKGRNFSFFKVGDISDAQKADLDKAINELKVYKYTKIANKLITLANLNYVGAPKDINKLQEAITGGNGDVIKETVNTAKTDTMAVEDGKYYRIVSANPKFEAFQQVKKSMYCNFTSWKLHWHTLDASDVSELFIAKKTDEGLYNFTTVNNAARCINGHNNASNINIDGTPVPYALNPLGDAQYHVQNKAGDIMHARDHGNGPGVQGAVMNYNEGYNSPSAWYLELVKKLTLKVGAAGFSTGNYPFAVSVPAGVKAYTGKIEGNLLKLKEITDNTIPAKTPVVFEASTNSYELTILYDNKTEALADNDLKGTLDIAPAYSPANVAIGSFVLAKPAGKTVGFYKLSAAGNLMNKAYLSATTASAVDFLHFDWSNGITAITEAAADVTTPVQYYDLNGRLVTNPSRGIYVTSKGEKVFIQ